MGNPNNQDWVRLEVLILRRACTILRKLFKRRWKTSQQSEWIDSPEFGKQFVSGLGSKIHQNCGRLHKLSLEEGDVNTWDFTMLTRILQQVEFLPKESPLKTEFLQENQRIEDLITYSKQAIDYPIKVMGDNEFSKLWDQIEKILVSFGENEKELEELKRSQSTSEEDLISLSGEDSHPIDQRSMEEAKRLKEQAKNIVNSGGDLQNAINLLSSAIALHNIPDLELGALLASRSDAYLKKSSGQLNKDQRLDIAYLALKDAKQALNLRPAWGLAYYRVGMAYVELNKLKKASKYLDKALDLEPNVEEIKVAHNSCKFKLVELSDDFAPDLKTFQPRTSLKPRPLPGGTRLSPEVMDRIDSIFFFDESTVLGDIYKAHKYRDGSIDTKQSYKEAATLYRKGVKSRNAEAMYNLALLKLEGQGVKQDVKGAIDLLKRAAKQPHKLCNGNGLSFVSNVGVVESSFLLGLLNCEGIGFPPQKDRFSASVWYLQASEHGHGPASHNLGLLYAQGQGVPRDEKRALQLWKLGAGRKLPESMLALAIHHAKEWDTGEARRWYETSMKTDDFCNYHDRENEEDSALWTPTEMADFMTVLETIEEWKMKYGQKEISRWESATGITPGRTMNQNLNMMSRLVRMLHGLDAEKEKVQAIEAYFRQLEPKPIIIPFPNAKTWTANFRQGIILNGSCGSSSASEGSTRSPSASSNKTESVSDDCFESRDASRASSENP